MFRRKQPSPVEENQENGQEKQNGEPKSTTVESTPSNDPPPVSFFRLFRFATKSETLSNSVGVVCAIAAGAAQVRIRSVLVYFLTRNVS